MRQALISSLKVLASLREHDKVSSVHDGTDFVISIQPQSIYQGITRQIKGESRENSIAAIESVLKVAFCIIDGNNEREKYSTAAVASFVALLESATLGLSKLSITYASDSSTRDRLSQQVANVKRRVHAWRVDTVHRSMAHKSTTGPSTGVFNTSATNVDNMLVKSLKAWAESSFNLQRKTIYSTTIDSALSVLEQPSGIGIQVVSNPNSDWISKTCSKIQKDVKRTFTCDPLFTETNDASATSPSDTDSVSGHRQSGSGIQGVKTLTQMLSAYAVMDTGKRKQYFMAGYYLLMSWLRLLRCILSLITYATFWCVCCLAVTAVVLAFKRLGMFKG